MVLRNTLHVIKVEYYDKDKTIKAHYIAFSSRRAAEEVRDYLSTKKVIQLVVGEPAKLEEFEIRTVKYRVREIVVFDTLEESIKFENGASFREDTPVIEEYAGG